MIKGNRGEKSAIIPAIESSIILISWTMRLCSFVGRGPSFVDFIIMTAKILNQLHTGRI